MSGSKLGLVRWSMGPLLGVALCSLAVACGSSVEGVAENQPASGGSGGGGGSGATGAAGWPGTGGGAGNTGTGASSGSGGTGGSGGTAQRPCSEKVERVAGATRYDTAVAVSQAAFPNGAPAAVLVRGVVSPDALCAGPLAKSLGGPVLLTDAATLPAATQGELGRLGVSMVYVIGGPASVSAEVVSTLQGDGYSVPRLAGASRYDTAAEVALQVGAASGWVVVASGEDAHLIDGLSASGAAAGVGAPILLVSSTAVPAATASALSSMGATKTLVVGGTGAIPDSVMQQLPQPTRVAGATRFETATQFAAQAKGIGLDTNHVFLVNAAGDDGIALGGVGDALLLAEASALPAVSAAFLGANSQTASLVGGTAALDASVEAAVCDALP